MSISDRDIWMFRQPRSGSTAITTFLAKKLNRDFLFVDFMSPTKEDNKITWGTNPNSSYLFNTHLFSLLSEVHRYTKPILLRCSRKNKFEQFLSEYTVGSMNSDFRNITKDGMTNTQPFLDFIQQKINIDHSAVQRFLIRKQQEDILWNQVSPSYDNHTIWYEDLTTSIDIPVLGIYNTVIECHTEKLPDYKEQVFTNYDQIKEWFLNNEIYDNN